MAKCHVGLLVATEWYVAFFFVNKTLVYDLPNEQCLCKSQHSG